MSRRPRTPVHFPRMKHRAAGRLMRPPHGVVYVEVMADLSRWAADVVAHFKEAYLALSRLQSDYVLSPTPTPRGTIGEWYEFLRERDRAGAKKPMPETGWDDLVTLEWLAVRHTEPLPEKIARTDPHRFRIDHPRDIVQVWSDPTHGTVDLDVQIAVDQMRPNSLGQRVALERTAQDRKDAGKRW